MPPSRRRAVDVAHPDDAVLRDLQDVIHPVRLASQPAPTDSAVVQDLVAAVRETPPVRDIPLPQFLPEQPILTVAHPLDVVPMRIRQTAVPPRGRWWFSAVGLAPWVVGAGIVISGLLYVSQYGLRTKSEVVRQGSAAVAAMLAAKDDAEQMHWESAGHNLRTARDGFAAARSELDVLGPAITGVLSHLPGLGSLRTGRNVLNAGRLLSEAGLQVSDAVGTLSHLGDEATAPGAKGISFAQAFRTLADALAGADANVTEASSLVDSIDDGDVPENLREQFASLRERIPHVRGLVADGADLVRFLGRFMGDGQPRRYLVLFQNSSELRPTGGFPGSYGILTVQDGKVTDWRADDIYNPDGQIKELIVPPLQLQHITPGWGMRDANWFADFSVSAPKVAAFWRRGGGTAVDGVIAIRPEVLGLVLKATGAISLQGYDAVITAENFLPILQAQVETDKPTGTPKRIIGDLAPVVLDRLASLPAAQWLGLLDSLKVSLDRRDVLMWFNDAPLQEYADAHVWSGRVLPADADYLMVNIANVAGAKADAVTATSVKLETHLTDGILVHRLTLTRRNDGNASPYGFYNKTNKSYVRVLVPKGSTLRGLAGNAHPQYRPLVDYLHTTVVRDPDLTALEATYQQDGRWDATTSEESGKTGFGFWMTVEPGATGTVQLEYAVPAAAAGKPYRLLVQRQPGLDLASFELTLDKPDLMVADSTPTMVEWPDSWRLHGTLDHDLRVEALLR